MVLRTAGFFVRPFCFHNTEMGRRVMHVISNLIKSAVIGGVLVMGTAQAQQMMPQGMMMPQQMMPQQMMPQGMMRQQQMMPQQMMPQGMMRQQQFNPLSMLKLDEEQQKKLKQIAEDAQKQTVVYLKSMGDAAKELQKLVTAITPDAKTIGDAYGKLFDIQRQIIEAGVATYNKELAVFTEEQRKLWNAMRKQMQGVQQQPAK
jgi:hypothetical protein